MVQETFFECSNSLFRQYHEEQRGFVGLYVHRIYLNPGILENSYENSHKKIVTEFDSISKDS